MLRSIRGATTVSNNDASKILEATGELINHIIRENALDISQITSIIFTCTKDLDKAYPAVSARKLGIIHAALICAQEMYVEGSLAMCIRLTISAEMDISQEEVKHIYLRGAKGLRPDITGASGSDFSVAIDGPSGVGKSTVAKHCAKELGFLYIDTGAIYRTFAYYCMESGIDITDQSQVDKIADTASIEVKFVNDRQIVYCKGIDVTGKIRSQLVADNTSKISTIASVRKRLVAMQQEFAKSQNVVMDGRDIGTVVLKDSPLKIYLDASAKIRAKRRSDELESMGQKADYQMILKEVIDRDHRDMNREIDPLKKAEDAVLIICDNLSASEVSAAICAIARKRMTLKRG
ncbi:MAG: (d)CMP kinase [Defluviitaleaceae bacterium]|nr:(d)CMP kinase [Defluviitaleaceae bacterium]